MHVQATDIPTLHRFNGVEQFIISSAPALVVPDGDTVRLHLEIEADLPPLASLPDTAPLAAQPGTEVAIQRPAADLGSLAGRRYSVPRSWDGEREDSVSRFYYCEHEAIDDNVIEFTERRGNWVHARWTGITTDVNWYDGSKPATRVEVVAWFKLAGRGIPADAQPLSE